MTGVCMPIGAEEKPTRDPQCGCDGITYWNATVAAKAGASTRGPGECGTGAGAALVCNGPGICTGGSRCNLHLTSKPACNSAVRQGTCWMLPTTCGIVATGLKTRACTAAAAICADECALIKTEKPYFDDAGCPQ